MLNDPTAIPDMIVLEARNAARNIARRYAIETSVDLFGAIIVDYRWGRIGTRGQGRSASFETSKEAMRFVGALQRRRQSALKRLGVRYIEVGRGNSA